MKKIAFILVMIFGTALGQQQLTTVCPEGSSCKVGMTFIDQNGQPVKPDANTILMNLDEQSTKTRILSGVSIPTPASGGTTEYTLSLCASKKLLTGRSETHVGSVVFSKAGIPGSGSFAYTVEDNPGWKVQENTPGTCTVVPQVTSTPTRTPTP